MRSQVIESARLLFRDEGDPFPAYARDQWELIADESLEVINIGPEISHLPKGDPRTGTEDALVVFMQEAWRTLQPLGVLMVKYPKASSAICLSDPLTARYLSQGTWLHFGFHAESEAQVPMRRDHGTNFKIVNIADEGTEYWSATLVKPEC